LGGAEVTVERKSIQASIDSITAPTDAKPYGGFIAIASDESVDRDGEVLLRSEWVTPLPDRITVDVDHGMSVATTIGSARPYFEGDRLMVDATFSSLERAQEVRSLVAEGHVNTMSIAALVDRSGSTPRRELLNVGIVAIPANPNARIIDSKTFRSALDGVLSGESVSKALGGDGAMVQAIHDAAGHLGAACIKAIDPTDDDSGITDDDGTGDDYRYDDEKALAALALRVKALRR
jgi:hypothetical protein